MSEICSSSSRLAFYRLLLSPNAAHIAHQIFYSQTLPLLEEKAAKVVFANIEDVLLTNTVRRPDRIAKYQLLNTEPFYQVFLSSLEERQKECRLYMDTIGDILRQHIPNMGIYLVPFLFFCLAFCF